MTCSHRFFDRHFEEENADNTSSDSQYSERLPLYFRGTIFQCFYWQRKKRVYCHFKLLKTEAFELAEAFHCSSTITGTQRCLVAPQLGEALSPMHPSVNGALKAIWLFVAPGISLRVESRVSDEDSIGEENKWHMKMGGIFSARAEEERAT